MTRNVRGIDRFVEERSTTLPSRGFASERRLWQWRQLSADGIAVLLDALDRAG
jgi:hypothetical protein